MQLYRGQAEGCTILAIGSPLRNEKITADKLSVNWSVVGVPAKYYRIAVDGVIVQDKISGTAATIQLDHIESGKHTLSVIADGAITRFPLSLTKLDIPLTEPILVRVDVPFTVD